MKRLIIDLEAEAEFEAAERWYEEERSGLGTVFREAVVAVLERVQREPEVGSFHAVFRNALHHY